MSLLDLGPDNVHTVVRACQAKLLNAVSALLYAANSVYHDAVLSYFGNCRKPNVEIQGIEQQKVKITSNFTTRYHGGPYSPKLN